VSLPTVRGRCSALLALASSLALGLPLHAQQRDPLARLDSASRRIVEALIDSARVAGLPTRQLVSIAQEGVSKHVDTGRVLSAVRTVLLDLREARSSLGANASPDELDAAAAALQAGIPPAALTELQGARHGKPMTVALVVLADLVTRGVPREIASSAIQQLSMGGAADGDLLALSHGVQQDILSGAAPGDALRQRVRQIPVKLPPSKVP
jgi:hypothetical protein